MARPAEKTLNCSRLVHDPFTTRSRLVHDSFTTCSRLVHGLFVEACPEDIAYDPWWVQEAGHNDIEMTHRHHKPLTLSLLRLEEFLFWIATNMILLTLKRLTLKCFCRELLSKQEFGRTAGVVVCIPKLLCIGTVPTVRTGKSISRNYKRF